jgi:AcrR family transcriptional regulator
MKSEQRARQLREALERAERSGAGRPYPEALRRAAIEYQRERGHEGASLRQVAAELGVSDASLVRWSRGKQESAAMFRAIEVVAEPVERKSAIVVHGPRGLRIEGLTVAELAGLLERLS